MFEWFPWQDISIYVTECQPSQQSGQSKLQLTTDGQDNYQHAACVYKPNVCARQCSENASFVVVMLGKMDR